MSWKIILIVVSILLIYFTYGIAQGGGPWAFFVGVAAGTIVTYLYTRAKQEAQSNVNVNTQNVSVNLNQHKLNIGGQQFTEEQYTAVSDLVDTVLERKLLLERGQIRAQLPSRPDYAYETEDDSDVQSTHSERIAALVRKMGKS